MISLLVWQPADLWFVIMWLMVFVRVYIGLLVSSLYSPTVIGCNHPIYFDIITYLNGHDHGEPSCAQPWVRFLSEQKKQHK